jgi:putative GTP pyrophosphokinase
MARTRNVTKTPKTSGARKAQRLGPTPDDIWQRNPEVIKQFLHVRRDYEQLCAEVEYILRKRITDQAIETSAISSRAKTLNSFLEKLQRKQYDSPFDRLTDLAGVRVVCLYRSDIAKVAQIIGSEFVIAEDVDKLDELRVDQFGYGARHFIVRLGKTSSGARYDDLKQLPCEVQVRTVVQDAWAIIQHHMVYKRESQVPTQLQRKLNSLAGLFETVDDQFERIREEREAYLAEVRDSVAKPGTFLEHELNLDSFKEYLRWAFPDRDLEAYDGQARIVLDALVSCGQKTLRDVDSMVKNTAAVRAAMSKEIDEHVRRADDGTIPSVVEPALAVSLSVPNWETLLVWGPNSAEIIRKHRVEQKGNG